MVKFYFKPRLRHPPINAKRFIFKSKKERIIFYIICAIIIPVIIALIGEMQLRPIIKNAGANALKNELTMLLNQAVNETVQNENSVYSDFVTVNYNENGAITSLITNTVYINSFKAALSQTVAQTVDRCGDFNITVPWGTLLGSEIFSDRGLELTVESSTYGFAVTDIYSSFESVGINQTLHKIYVEIDLTATAYIGDYKVHETVNGRVPVAETVIVGNVPQYYSQK